MRNLRKIRHAGFSAGSQVTATCWDANTDEVLIASGPTHLKAEIELSRVTGFAACEALASRTIARWPVQNPRPDAGVDRIVNIHHFSGSLATCVVLAGGDIVLVQEDGSKSNDAHIEIVGSVDAGITAARWSPDEELLCITTDADTVVLMSRSFDGISEAIITAEDLNISKHVSVGWGKKETQFRGKGAKALRDPTIPEKVDEGLPSHFENGRTAISWRGDGAYIAVNSLQKGSRRAIRVYTRDAVLESVSEPVDGLEETVSWRPAGNLIAGIQRWDGIARVVFFERNGLRHGEFTLRMPKIANAASYPQQAIRLEWNTDSTVLAVLYRGVAQLWTMGNYHWYLKQTVPIFQDGVQLAWHPEKALIFTTASSLPTRSDPTVPASESRDLTSDRVACYEYIFTVARGSVLPPHDMGAVAVIDGPTVKLTPFKQANVPPPMALYELDTRADVIDVAFDEHNEQLAVLHQADVCLYKWPSISGRLQPPATYASQNLDSNGIEGRTVLQVCFPGSQLLAVLSLEDTKGVVSFYHLDSPSSRVIHHRDQEVVPGLMNIGSVLGADGELFGQGMSRGFLRGLSQEPMPVLRLQQQLPWLEARSSPEDSSIVPVGLAKNGNLYAGLRLLAKNCTSFLLTADHIVYTTTASLLKFVHLEAVAEMEVPPDDPERDERCRSIERGARLITAMPSRMSVVLQMPRGNLETIYPRAMVIAGIRKLLDEREYGKAFSVCRTQRVDMNLLCDYQPNLFLANVGLFLDELKETAYIDLFLSSLRSEDVTVTLYRDTKRTASTENQVDAQTATTSGNDTSTPNSKVNRVCDAVLQNLRSRKSANLQNIITAHLCKEPPALDDALGVAAGILAEKGEDEAERVVEHICFLADVNRAYDHALGLYNLPLTTLVAQQSQRDPREYLPFVQKLFEMPDARRCFTIDDHLGRWEKALAHLKELDAFDEFCGYTTKHALYRSAFRLYRYDESRLRTLTELYAAHLESISDFKQAGLTYESLHNYVKATGCYRAAGSSCWRECLGAAQLQTPAIQPQALLDLATAQADAVYEAKDYSGAATIQLEYLSQPVDAIRSLCKGYHFAEAIRIASKTAQPDQDLLSAVLDPCLLEALSSSTEFVADCRGQLQAQVPRVLELRQRAIEDPLAFYEGERPTRNGEDIPDDISVVSDAASRMSTSASLFTRYTGKDGSVGTLASNVSRASSRNRKREEKKRARGRKGTVYEEEYLVNSVRRLVERVDAAKDELERLVIALVRRGMAERARAVEMLMAEVLDACNAAVVKLWPEMPADAHSTQQQSQDLRDGRPPPIVSKFERLSLLG